MNIFRIIFVTKVIISRLLLALQLYNLFSLFLDFKL